MALQSNAHLRLLNALLPVRSVFLLLFPICKLAFINICLYTVPTFHNSILQLSSFLSLKYQYSFAKRQSTFLKHFLTQPPRRKEFRTVSCPMNCVQPVMTTWMLLAISLSLAIWTQPMQHDHFTVTVKPKCFVTATSTIFHHTEECGTSACAV